MRTSVGAEEVGGAEVLVQVQEDSAFVQKRCCGSAECRGGAEVACRGGAEVACRGGASGASCAVAVAGARCRGGREVEQRWSRGGAEVVQRECRGGAEVVRCKDGECKQGAEELWCCGAVRC